MKKTRTILTLTMSAWLAASGCGPWGSSGTREVKIAIPWGPAQAGLHAQVIPSNATKITVKISGNDFAPIERTIERPGVTAYGVTQPTTQPTVTPTVAPTTSPTPVSITVTSVTVNPATASVTVGNTTTFTATVNLSNAATETAVTWSSNTPTVATVDPTTGVVTGVAAGTSTITAISNRDTTKTGTATVTVVAAAGTNQGTLTPSTAGVQGMRAVAVDPSSNVWVVNGGSNNVTKFNGSTGAEIGTFAVGNSPQDIAIDRSSGNVWVTNFNTDNVTVLNSSGTPITGSPFGVTGCGPVGIAIDSTGSAWIACSTSGNVIKLSSALAMQLNVNKATSNLEDVAIDSSGNVWVTHRGLDNVLKLNNADGSTLANVIVGNTPIGVAIDGSNNAWVVINGTNRVAKVNNAGTVVTPFGVGTFPQGVAVDNGGNVWVSNTGSGNVTRLDNNGNVLGTFAITAGVSVQPAIDRSNPKIYVPNGPSNTVTILSTGGPLGILALRPQQLLPSPSPLPSAGVFDQNSTVVVLKFQVPIGTNRLLEATAYDSSGKALVGARVFFNVPAGGPVPDVEVFMTVQGLSSPAPTPSVLNIAGRWTYTATSTRGSVTGVMDLTQTGNSVTGTYSESSNSSGTAGGTVSGNNFALTFQQTAPCAGTFPTNGTVSGNTMTFTGSGSDCKGNDTFQGTATR